MTVEFECDEAKSQSNLAKHGIDFVTAQQLWNDASMEIDSSYEGEPRQLVIGRISGRPYTAIVTRRGNRTRIISVRRSRDSEVSAYEDYQR